MPPAASGRRGRGRGRARWRPADPFRREIAELTKGDEEAETKDPKAAADALGAYPELERGVARKSSKIPGSEMLMLDIYREINDAVRDSPYYMSSNETKKRAPLRYSDLKKRRGAPEDSLWDGEIPWIYASLLPDELRPQDGKAGRTVKRLRRSAPKGIRLDISAGVQPMSNSLVPHEPDSEEEEEEAKEAEKQGLVTRKCPIDSDDEDEEASEDGDDEERDNKRKSNALDKKSKVKDDLPDEDIASLDDAEHFIPNHMFDDDSGYVSQDSGQDLPTI